MLIRTEPASYHASSGKNFEVVPKFLENFFHLCYKTRIFVEGLKMAQNIFVIKVVMHSKLSLPNTKQDTDKSIAVLDWKT